MNTPQIGSIVGGKYRLVQPLGEGGMGAVFEVEHTVTQKRAAVKWLHPHFAAHEQGYQRVINEARAASRIRHENVVDVYDVIREGDAILLVMELLIGEPLSALLERESLAMHELVRLLLPVLHGLAAAHVVGVVHRDIKPENIFLARESGYSDFTPKIIDFGISKVFDTDASHVTGSGVAMGTPKYVSYEQLMGARDVDARTDVYAFGVMLYEALTGSAPYGEAANLAEQAVRFVTISPSSPCALRPDVPAELDQLVRHCVARDRQDRLPSIDALALRLAPFAEAAAYGTPLPAYPPSAARPGGPLSTKPTPSALQLIRANDEVAPTVPARSPRDQPHVAVARRSLPVPNRGQQALGWGGLTLLLAGAVAFFFSHTTHERQGTGQRASADAAVGASASSVTAPAAPPLRNSGREQPELRALEGESVDAAQAADGGADARAQAAGPISARRPALRGTTLSAPPRDAAAAAVREHAREAAVDAGAPLDEKHRAGRVRRHEF